MPKYVRMGTQITDLANEKTQKLCVWACDSWLGKGMTYLSDNLDDCSDSRTIAKVFPITCLGKAVLYICATRRLEASATSRATFLICPRSSVHTCQLRYKSCNHYMTISNDDDSEYRSAMIKLDSEYKSTMIKTCNNMTKTIIPDHFHSGVGSTTPLLWY